MGRSQIPEAAKNELQLKIERKRKLLEDLRRIIRQMDQLSIDLYAPERFTAQEWDKLASRYRSLELEYEQKELTLKTEYPFKDIEREIENLSIIK